MKGLSVKKLAAIAVGGALIGSALAPVVSAAVTSNIDTLQKSDIISATTGEPVVNVVVGSLGAATSDFVWAGNIAAKIAQLATVEKSVSVTGGGEEATAEPTDLTVDVTVGGEVTYSTESSQTYSGNQYPLLSDPSGTTTNDPLVKILTEAQLPFLTNETKTYRWAGSSYSIVVKETIGIKADARMDLIDKDVEDLVVYLSGEGDFNYVLDLGEGIPAYDTLSSASAFTDGDNDNIVIPFLGETFTVQQVDNNSGTVKLIKESDKATYYEGEEISGLEGKGNYDGEELSVKVDAVTQAGAASTSYNVRYLLLDSEGNEIDRQTLGSGVYLNENFVDSSGEYALETVVYISDAGVESTTSKGYVTATVGKSVVDLKDGKAYPYDSTDTDTTDDYWKASLTFGTDNSPAVATLQKITIKNAVKKWDSTNPLYPSSGALTEAGQGASGEAIFLEGNNESDLGYNFVRFKFDGFDIDQSTTTIKLGRGACETSEGQAAGCVIYTDNAGVEREVPFYYELSLTTGPTDEGTFMLDDQTFYYRCDRTDTNMLFGDGNYLNGIALQVWTADSVQWVASDWNSAHTDANGENATDINGLWTTPYDNSAGNIYVSLPFDGNCQFSKQSFSNFSSSDILKANGQTPYYNTMFYDDDNQSLDKVIGYAPIEVTNDSLNDTYKYNMYVSDESSYKKVYLLLDSSTNFTNEFSVADVTFSGTDGGALSGTSGTYYAHPADTVEDGIAVADFYIPDKTALGQDPSDYDYIVANFGFDTNTTGGTDVNAYIDTSTGELIGFPNAQRNGYPYQVDINNLQSWGLRTDSPDTQTAATWLDYGSKVELISTDTMGDYVKLTIPESQIYLKYAVLGQATTVTAEGGTSFTGLAEGESGEEGATKVTVDAINYTAGVCPAAGGAVAEPSTYKDIVPVGQLVYLDTPEPAGANIIVGGWLVNKLVSASTSLGEGEGTLGEALTTSGDRVVQLLDNGDIIVAGYTANDTKQAAQDLITQLDTLLG
jgi:hypothetical protein